MWGFMVLIDKRKGLTWVVRKKDKGEIYCVHGCLRTIP